MAEEVNEKKMIKELIKLYEDFLDNPKDDQVISRLIAYDRIYGGLATDHYQKYISPVLFNAIGALSSIFQYGIWNDEDHEAFSNEKLISVAKETLKELKIAEAKIKP